MLGMLVVMAGLAATVSPRSPAEETVREGDTVRIGMVNSLFKDVPETTMMAMMQPFGAVMRTQTGVSGQLVPGGDYDKLGRQIAESKIHLGVLHGVEYAWVRQKHPELRALVVAVNHYRQLRAHLIVSGTDSATRLEDLQDKVLSLPAKTREHCLLFLDRRCKQSKKSPSTFFAKVATPPNVAEALDDVIDGLAQVTVADAVALNWFKEQKPGRYARLRILESSEAFPAGAIIFRPGTIDERTLDKFRSGMMNANRTILGRELLTLWHLSAFESVPDDYDQTLADIAKVYPPPNAGK
jgi:ABC-type phosphate/phosphonate transport system substrate-binding protein